jgi:hypothetical protein
MAPLLRVLLIAGTIALAGQNAGSRAQDLPPFDASSEPRLESVSFHLEPGTPANAAHTPRSSLRSVTVSSSAPIEVLLAPEMDVGPGQPSRGASAMAADAGEEDRLGANDPGASAYVQPGLLTDPYAQEQSRWTDDLVALEVAFQVANALDAVTTDRCVRRANCSEVNPLFGKNPSSGLIYGAKAAGGLLHYFSIDMLAKADPATARTVAWITAIFQTGVAGFNLSQSF